MCWTPWPTLYLSSTCWIWFCVVFQRMLPRNKRGGCSMLLLTLCCQNKNFVLYYMANIDYGCVTSKRSQYMFASHLYALSMLNKMVENEPCLEGIVCLFCCHSLPCTWNRILLSLKNWVFCCLFEHCSDSGTFPTKLKSYIAKHPHLSKLLNSSHSHSHGSSSRFETICHVQFPFGLKDIDISICITGYFCTWYA